MTVLLSFCFNIAFYINMVLWLLLALPLLALPSKYLSRTACLWARSNFWLLEHIAGIKYEFRCKEEVPKGALLIASKHQSFWETFAFFVLFEEPLFVLKRELIWIPVFGWYLKKIGCIAVDRQAGEKSIRIMVSGARRALSQNRQIVIFPEGTRTAPGSVPSYKRGVELLYRILKVPCLPVALNSGIFWPRRRFIRKPGTIIVEACPLIEPGLKGNEFMKIMQERIEAVMVHLVSKDGDVQPSESRH